MSGRQIAALLLVALAVAVAMQNTQSVVLRALVWRVTVPQLVALLSAAAVGFAVGAIMTKTRRRTGKV